MLQLRPIELPLVSLGGNTQRERRSFGRNPASQKSLPCTTAHWLYTTHTTLPPEPGSRHESFARLRFLFQASILSEKLGLSLDEKDLSLSLHPLPRVSRDSSLINCPKLRIDMGRIDHLLWRLTVAIQLTRLASEAARLTLGRIHISTIEDYCRCWRRHFHSCWVSTSDEIYVTW